MHDGAGKEWCNAPIVRKRRARTATAFLISAQYFPAIPKACGFISVLARTLLKGRHRRIFRQATESELTMTMHNWTRNLVAAMASIVIATTCTFAAAGPALMSWTA